GAGFKLRYVPGGAALIRTVMESEEWRRTHIGSVAAQEAFYPSLHCSRRDQWRRSLPPSFGFTGWHNKVRSRLYMRSPHHSKERRDRQRHAGNASKTAQKIEGLQSGEPKPPKQPAHAGRN